MSRFAIFAALAAAMLTAPSAIHASETGWSMAVNPLSPEAPANSAKTNS